MRMTWSRTAGDSFSFTSQAALSVKEAPPPSIVWKTLVSSTSMAATPSLISEPNLRLGCCFRPKVTPVVLEVVTHN